MAELLLDERILWWVFFPIVYVTLALALLRTYFSKYSAYKTAKKTVKQKSMYQAHEERNLIAKCDQLIKKHAFIPEDAFNSRRTFLCAEETGYLTKDKPAAEPVDQMAQMQSMMDGMGGMGGMLPTILFSMLTIGWISQAFGGILLAKVPFNLAEQFKSMTQNGIEMENLSVQYISGTSFYFFIMFGIGQLLSLIPQDEDERIEAIEASLKAPGANPKMGANPMSMMPMSPMAPMDQQNQSQKPADKFKSQIESLCLVHHHFAFDNCKKTAADRLRKFLAEQ